MKVFVTGSTGLLGSYLCWNLLLDNYQVVAYIRPSARLDELKDVFGFLNYQNGKSLQLSDIQFIRGEFEDDAALNEALLGCESVFHCAGKVSFLQKDINSLFEVNVDNTAKLINLSIELNIKFFNHVSSVAVFPRGQQISSMRLVTEKDFNAIPENASNYGKSKYLGEMEVWRGQAEGLIVRVINPSIILGYGDFTKGSLKIVNTIKRGFPFYPSGSNGYVYADDVAKMFIKLTENPKSENQRFIISSENIASKILFEWISKIYKVSPPKLKSNYLVNHLGRILMYLASKLTGKDAIITKETIRSIEESYSYNGELVLEYTDLKYTSIQKILNQIYQYGVKKD